MKWEASLKIWRDTRGIQAQPEDVFEGMIAEERQEYIDATEAEDWDEQVDAICDQVVLTSNHLNFNPDRVDLQERLSDLLKSDLPNLGVVPDLAMKQTLKEISSREQDPAQATRWQIDGGNITGEKWQKDRNQDPATLYKANYDLAKAKRK